MLSISYKCRRRIRERWAPWVRKYGREIYAQYYTAIAKYSMCVLLVLISLPSFGKDICHLGCVELRLAPWNRSGVGKGSSPLTLPREQRGVSLAISKRSLGKVVWD